MTREWRLANPEKVKAQKRRYYLKYRERCRLKAKEKYKQDKVAAIKRASARYEVHKKEILASKRAKYAEDPQPFLAMNQKSQSKIPISERRQRYRQHRLLYIARNPDRYQSNERKRRQKRRAIFAGSFIEPVDPAAVFARDKGLCGICGGSVRRDGVWHIDHIIPLCKGGPHSYDNVQLAHGRCNLSKGSKLPTGRIVLLQSGGKT